MPREYIRNAEKVLGRSMPPGSIVHHQDGDRKNNVNSNLVILVNQGEHLAVHARLRVVRAGGDPWRERICSTCRQLVLFTQMARRRGGYAMECKACVAQRTHRHFCERTGRANRKLTPQELSTVQRANACLRWQNRG